MPSRRDFLKSALLLPAAELLVRSGYAQPPASAGQPRWLTEIALQLQKEFYLPAVWVAANIEGKVEAAVVGVKKSDDPTPATLEDKLTVASISKPMTGFWIATLVDRGKLSYESKAMELLPELESVCLPEHKDITLGQLLTHTAGVIRDVTKFPSNLSLEAYPAERLRQAREVLSSPSPPGSKGKEVYSNNGVTLAASMGERAAGEAYETAAGRLYRDRLGLKSWGVWPMNLHDDLTQPWPHAIKENSPVPQSPQSVQFQFVRPSGGAHCTITDLVRFGLIATNATRLARPILKPETWETYMAPVPNTSAALSSFHAYGERANFGHAGSLGTTSSNLLIFPEWQVSFAVHTNASADAFRERGIQLLQDAIRKRRAERNPPAPCSLQLTSVATMDDSWMNEIAPRVSDDKIRIRVNFHIEAGNRTGDLQTLVKLGDVERRDDRFRGLASGNHTLHFEFDTPKTRTTPAIVRLDALRTAGNRTPKTAFFESVLTLE